jgi:hypothetical protein
VKQDEVARDLQSYREKSGEGTSTLGDVFRAAQASKEAKE